MHRYVFMLFAQQNGKIDNENFIARNSMENRSNFSTRKFIEKFSLKPIGGNFFTSEFDSFVPVIYQETFGDSM